ncbi:hypothetical protein [Parasphingorhabdus cellanae]|uniref:SH3b domain-containing protein n=1 Tax=Parasphingorhabdus cellanae TaxID=2806553 RepID=A0ABX7T6T0_9SPHN|nr:hypothetical protein [Parasphingorhabdus cellanae]QTD57293.1 hypothetical protein J4G78_07115 [Parasphingorhabdus cellanae]
MMNREEYDKLMKPYSHDFSTLYEEVFGDRKRLQDILGGRSPCQSAVDRVALGLGENDKLKAITESNLMIQEQLGRISEIYRRGIVGDSISAGVMSHAEELAKIQDRIFPERVGLAAAAGLSDVVSKSLSGLENVGLDEDVLARIADSTSRLTRQIDRDLHLGTDKSLFGSMADFDKLFEDQMAPIRDAISGFAKPSSLGLAALTARDMVPRGAVAGIFKQITDPLALERDSFFENSLKGLQAFDRPDIEPDILANAIVKAHDEVEKSKMGGMGLEFAVAWMTFLMLLVTLWSAYMQREMWQMQDESSKANEKLNATVEQIKKSASGISSTLRQRAEDQRTVRYLHGDAALRIEPHKSAEVLRYIYPDQLIRVVDTKGHWAKVEILDYRTEKPERGWIARSQLRIKPVGLYHSRSASKLIVQEASAQKFDFDDQVSSMPSLRSTHMTTLNQHSSASMIKLRLMISA